MKHNLQTVWVYLTNSHTYLTSLTHHWFVFDWWYLKTMRSITFTCWCRIICQDLSSAKTEPGKCYSEVRDDTDGCVQILFVFFRCSDVVVNSGGSRIFHRSGANHKVGANLLFGSIILKNCIRNEKKMDPEGARIPLAPLGSANGKPAVDTTISQTRAPTPRWGR